MPAGKEESMRFRSVLGIAATVVGVAVAALLMPVSVVGQEEMMEMEEMKEMPFGGAADVAFGKALWTAMDGYQDWLMQSDVLVGGSPHGMFVRLYYSIVTVDGVPYHVIVKDNFGGMDVTLDMVTENPADYLMAVTVMVQREAGYDPDNNDWYWVKYDGMGAVGKNDMDMFLAGRVAKGMPMGCIACHVNAKDGDYLFADDPVEMPE
jgi:hypothetical protein